MAAGLQCWDAAGNLVLDVSTYVAASTGSFTTNGNATGTYTDARLIGKSMVHFLVTTGDHTSHGGPVVTFNAATGAISWEYTYNVTGPGGAPTIPNETIYYGSY